MIDTLASPYMHAANSENFKALVLDNSAQGPVLVNFWSRKAGPCLRQSPVLDQLIHHYAGRVLLINVDVDSEFVFSKEYGIASVPTLKLFRHGQVVETLHGFQSEAELKKILGQYVTRDSDLKLADAIELFTGGKARAAYEMIAELIVEDPDNPRLPLTMCKLLQHEGRYLEASKLIESLPVTIRTNKEVRQFAAFLSFFLELDGVADQEILQEQLTCRPEDLGLKRQLIARLVSQQQFEDALQWLAEIIDIDPGFEDNYAQQATLRVFAILGDGHPLIKQFQPGLRRYTH